MAPSAFHITSNPFSCVDIPLGIQAPVRRPRFSVRGSPMVGTSLTSASCAISGQKFVIFPRRPWTWLRRTMLSAGRHSYERSP